MTMNAFRNLYRVKSAAEDKLVALITSASYLGVLELYEIQGGSCKHVLVEQISHGYPNDVCNIFA